MTGITEINGLIWDTTWCILRFFSIKKLRTTKFCLLALSSNVVDYLINTWIEGKLHNVLKTSNYLGDNQTTNCKSKNIEYTEKNWKGTKIMCITLPV